MRISIRFLLLFLVTSTLLLACATTTPNKEIPNLILDLRSAPIPVMLNEDAPTIGITAEFSSGERLTASTGYGKAYGRGSSGQATTTTVTTTTITQSHIGTPISNQMQMAWLTGPTAIWLTKIAFSQEQVPNKSEVLLNVKIVVTK